MKILLYFFAGFLLLTETSALAQNEVSVNQATGTLNAVIPIYAISRGAVTIPVNLVYSSNGIKVTDPENNAGIGWQVIAGGQITRAVRGLPDDVKKDNASNARLGWLYNTNGTKIDNFTISNSGAQGTCTDQTADLNYISTKTLVIEKDLKKPNTYSVSYIDGGNNKTVIHLTLVKQGKAIKIASVW